MTMQDRKRRDRGPKGRALIDAALQDVRDLLGDRPRRRDLLIEHLHLIQDRFGSLSAAHLRALAEDMRLSQAEVYEVASFYDHFDIVKEGETPPAPLTIRVCDSVSCMLAGAEKLVGELSAAVDPASIRVVRAPCMGRCAGAPAARIGDREVDHATAERLQAMARDGETDVIVPAHIDLAAYLDAGGYQTLRKVRSGEIGVDAIMEKLQDAGLRGLGGAGFPAGKKWGFVRSYPGPRLMSVNGDEGEPGTFKDRIYLEKDPHRTFEGALIAAHAVEAERIYYYMRDEYPAVLAILRKEIAALEAAEIVTPGFIELRRGAGAYICGEESAMIESIEGKRGLPRNRPPYVAEVGLFGRPTLNHNVETLVVDTRHHRERSEVVCRQGQARPSRRALVVGIGPGEAAGRQACAGRHHGARTDRRLLRRHGRGPRVQGLFAGRRLRRYPARRDGRRAAWISAASLQSLAHLSAPMRSWCFRRPTASRT